MFNSKKATLFALNEELNGNEETRNKQSGNNVKNREVPKPQIYKVRKCRNINQQTGIHNQEALEDSERKCSECREKYLQTTNEEELIEGVRCRNCCPSCVLHTKTNALAGVEDDCQRKTAKCRRENRKFRSLQT
jgi:hypothetical protein